MRCAGPLGLRLERTASWRHIQIQAPELGRLLLAQDRRGNDRRCTGGAPAGELWLGLANLALSADGQGPPDGADPLIVARAIDDQVGQVAYDRVVLDYLGQMAEEVSGRAGAWEPRARERVSRLMASLDPSTLRSLLQAGADHAERRRFALTASEVLAVDAVVEVVEAAAVTTGQSISSHLLRLLHKFAHHAERATGTARAEAESVLRTNVAQLIANWELDDPNPTEYTAVLEGMVRQAPQAAAVDANATSCEAGNGPPDRARDRLHRPEGVRRARQPPRPRAFRPGDGPADDRTHCRVGRGLLAPRGDPGPAPVRAGDEPGGFHRGGGIGRAARDRRPPSRCWTTWRWRTIRPAGRATLKAADRRSGMRRRFPRRPD